MSVWIPPQHQGLPVNPKSFKAALPVLAAAGVIAALAVSPLSAASAQQSNQQLAYADSAGTAPPIKHVVVIFQDNVSFDHYFGTYPHASNTSGQAFTDLPA